VRGDVSSGARRPLALRHSLIRPRFRVVLLMIGDNRKRLARAYFWFAVRHACWIVI